MERQAEVPASTEQGSAFHPRSTTSRALSTAEYRALCAYSPVMIWRAGVDARCDYFNERWLAFTGRSLEQELGNGWAEGVHPDDLKQCLERYLDAFEKREEFEMEYRLRRYDGVYRWIVDRGTPWYAEDGSFTGYIGSCVDVDDRRRALREREELYEQTLTLYHELHERDAKIRQLVEANIIGVAVSDPNGLIIDANDAFLAMLGYTKEDVWEHRLRWQELTPPEWRALSDQALDRVRQTGRCEAFEKEYFRRDGSRVPVLIGAAGVGERDELVRFVLDISDRKRAEEERERLRQAEAELTYMSRVVMMGELAASLAHDIRQPLTAAVVSADTCVRLLGSAAPDLEEAREAALRMAVESMRASDIIDRVRALFARNAPKQDVVDLNDLIGEMARLLGREATRHRVSIRIELDAALPRVIADRVQLQQVLMNLMMNAIEAMPEGGEMVVSSRRSGAAEVEITVSDTGDGIPAEHGDRIFDPFVTTKPNGTGMGLAISRAIVESHGGRLSAAANEERGATFSFTLPVKPAT